MSELNLVNSRYICFIVISLLSRKLPVPSGSQMKLFLPVILIQYRFLKKKISKPQLICYAIIIIIIIIIINTARMSEEFSNISSHSFSQQVQMLTKLISFK